MGPELLQLCGHRVLPGGPRPPGGRQAALPMALLGFSSLFKPWGREPRLAAPQPVAPEPGKVAGRRQEPRRQEPRTSGAPPLGEAALEKPATSHLSGLM